MDLPLITLMLETITEHLGGLAFRFVLLVKILFMCKLDTSPLSVPLLKSCGVQMI